jgi:SAM-dependent methyltransferase
MSSSSYHKLNSDRPIGFIKKIIWILLNYIVNMFGKLPEEIPFKKFKVQEDLVEFENTANTPARILSDLFWRQLDWDIIKSELGEINVFDVGAGSGRYALKLNEYFSEINSYFGVDFFENESWIDLMQKHDFITMKQASSDDVFEIIPSSANFIMSQSAIEHFENDLTFFRNVKKFIDKSNDSVVQVHLFPSPSCLKTYLLHGVRQYGFGAISRILEIFNTKNTRSVLYSLGGSNCNNLHFNFITKPHVLKRKELRKEKPQEYAELLKKAIHNDNNRIANSSFYALVIYSNFNRSIVK